MKGLITVLAMALFFIFAFGVPSYSQDFQKVEIDSPNDTISDVGNTVSDLKRKRSKSDLWRDDTDPWYTDDPNDYTPLAGTTWNFITDFDTRLVFFGSTVNTDSDGDIYIDSNDAYGNVGRTYYTEDLLELEGRGFWCYLESSGQTDNIDFEFTVDGGQASGYYLIYDETSDNYTASGLFMGAGTDSPGDVYYYYLPYFVRDSNRWTGVALKNTDESRQANVNIYVFDENGNQVDAVVKELPPKGQDAFQAGENVDGEGWVMAISDTKLAGLCFVGTIADRSYMFDIALIDDKATMLHVPHVAQDNQWDAVIYICNPNNAAAAVTLTFVDPDGNGLFTKTKSIPSFGSGVYALSEIVDGTDQPKGSVEIASDKGVAAFALYNDLKSGGMNYAGISAVP